MAEPKPTCLTGGGRSNQSEERMTIDLIEVFRLVGDGKLDAVDCRIISAILDGVPESARARAKRARVGWGLYRLRVNKLQGVLRQK